jgi:NAD(P)-dependent dehydrogenase (short-subunit alcohol dehydrogenase family)
MTGGVGSAIVIGASRGIGLAITKTLLESESIRFVGASYREAASAEGLLGLSDARLHGFPVDVTDEHSLKALADEIRQRSIQPDLVIHCAGILHEPGLQPEKALRQCAPEPLQRIFAVNSIGPLLTAKHLVPLMPKRQPGHFAALSAMVGSISDNRLGGWYGYRASKSALNQFLRTLAIECARTHPGLCITAIHPGTTDTELSRPFQGNVAPDKLYSTGQSAQRILQVVLSGTPDVSGRFMNWDGEPIPF